MLGDFNANYQKRNDSKDIKTIIETNGFDQLVKDPTYITKTSESIIDLIATNNPTAISNIIVHPLPMGDHELIGCVRKCNNIKYESKTVRYRDYKNYDHNILCESVRNINWKPLYEMNDVDMATNYFTNSLKHVFDTNAPFKIKTIRGKPAPWLKKDIKRYIDNKNRLLRKARKSKKDEDWEEYKHARNKCNSKIKEAKRKYHRQLIESNKANPKKFWDAVKEVFPSKTKLSVGSITKSESKNLVNEFSRFFSNIVGELKSKVVSFSNYVWRYHDKKGIRTAQKFHFVNVSKSFVEKQLRSLKRRKAAGPDELPPGMIKDCRNEILDPLTYIINLSLRNGKVPSLWKIARVVPVFKSGNIKKPENYRPISILTTFSKILERAIHTQLSSYLEKNFLLCNEQFGYRSNRSTKLASTLLCDNIRKSLDKGELVGAVFIDLTKAFDTVGHGVLLNKLYEYGIEGIEHDWMKSYLFNRQQFVFLDGVASENQSLLSGVYPRDPYWVLCFSSPFSMTFLTLLRTAELSCMQMTL